MSIDSVDSLVTVLRDTQLLFPPERLGEITRVLAKRLSDPMALVRYLQQIGWLTAYQTEQLSRGSVTNLTYESFVLLDRLGEGGVGQVFKARDIRNNQLCAVKILREAVFGNHEALVRFQREVRVATRLVHPNIVRAFDARLTENSGFMAMEYLEGVDLDKLLKREGRLALGMACDYVRQAANGLQCAHEHGLVHRDMKPANLLVQKNVKHSEDTPYGLIKILDMGLARVRRTDGMQGQSVTLEGATLGTPDYMAPEQARNPRTVDIRADLYSLGCTLYHLLTGQVPFSGGSVMQKLFRHQREEPVPAQRISPEVPFELSILIQKMLAKSPDDRFSEPEEVAMMLTPFCDL
jgi:serine/threonine-protein kinase